MAEEKTPHYYDDPPPPYSHIASDEMNNLSQEFSNVSVSSNHPHEQQNYHFSNSSIAGSNNVTPTSGIPQSRPSAPWSLSNIYPSLDSSFNEGQVAGISRNSRRATMPRSLSMTENVVHETPENRQPPGTLPPLLPLKATRSRLTPGQDQSPGNCSGTRHNNSSTSRLTTRNSDGALLSNPPPYNPFYEWSSFPSQQSFGNGQ